MKTICVVDLIQEATITHVHHNSKIDWIELNETSQKLLFRDKKMRYIFQNMCSVILSSNRVVFFPLKITFQIIFG